MYNRNKATPSNENKHRSKHMSILDHLVDILGTNISTIEPCYDHIQVGDSINLVDLLIDISEILYCIEL